VAKVSAQALSVERIEELVSSGVIELDNPENFHVTEFAIVLTLGKKEYPVSIPIDITIGEPEQIGF
jgi:hypothetical protein